MVTRHTKVLTFQHAACSMSRSKVDSLTREPTDCSLACDTPCVCARRHLFSSLQKLTSFLKARKLKTKCSSDTTIVTASTTGFVSASSCGPFVRDKTKRSMTSLATVQRSLPTLAVLRRELVAVKVFDRQLAHTRSHDEENARQHADASSLPRRFVSSPMLQAPSPVGPSSLCTRAKPKKKRTAIHILISSAYSSRQRSGDACELFICTSRSPSSSPSLDMPSLAFILH